MSLLKIISFSEKFIYNLLLLIIVTIIYYNNFIENCK